MNYLKVLAILSLLFIFCGSVYGAGEADSPDINGVNAVIDDTITVENASLTYDKLITSNNCEEVVIGDNSIWDVPIREGPIVENDNTSIPVITLKGENGNNMSFNNPADVFINESFNFQMVFKNLGDATGFQPYIQLIAPDELTHFTVSYSNKKIVPIKVGVFNESTYDNTTGLYTLRDPFTKKEVHGPANSTFYILQYPLGSFTVDAPDAVLNITSGIGVLEIGKLLNFTVTPVFRYGNSPIDDPVNYPPIYGETVTGWVNPVVVKIDKSSSLNEHETATGSNFPFSYFVNINIANGAKIENITITDVIPSDVMYLGSPVLYDSKGRVIDSSLYTIEEPAGNKTGGKLILKLKEAVGDLSTTSITLKYKAYAPEFDNSTGDNITIINSETGGGVAAASTVDMNYTYVNDTYNASNSYSIYLKSLATQKYSEILTGSGQLHPVVPHNLIVYKIDFEISDYFAFDDLVIYDKFDTHKVGSAQKFLSEYEPVLSIYGKTYELNESYYSVVSLGDIDESVTFYISKFLKDNNISTSLKGGYYTNRSVNQGAMVGSLNFVAKVIIHYSNGSSVVSNDLVINHVKTSATVLNTFNTVSDNSYTQLRVPSVTLKKDIIAVNGEIINDTDFYKVYPGQNITFVLDIHFPTGSVNDFIVTDFLPIPLFNLKGFNLVNSTTGVIPKGGYWAYANDSGFLHDENTGKVIVPKIGIDTFNNALSFNFGNTLDNMAHPVDVRLWFTFQVSSEPMADQLNLANLAEMKFKDSIDVVYASSNIVLMLTNEPELKITKYVNDTKILENIENATEVEYNITITNTGHSAAYDIIVADDFVNRTTSNGITKADVKSVSLVYSNGTVVDITAFKDDVFTKGYMIAQLAQNTSCSIIYTVRFSEYLIPKESIVNNVWITNFAAYPNSTNFATNKDKYRDNATIIAKGLNITKEFIGSNVTDNTEILFVGEVGIYKITVNFPDLRVPNLVIKDESYGIKYTNFTITTSDGVTVPEYAYTVTYTPSTAHPEKSYLTIDFNGDLVPAYAKNNQLIVNAYYTVVNNENVIPTGADSVTTSNHASISWTNNTLNSDTVYVDIYQPKIDINKVFEPNIVQGNDEASFTITVTNSGKGTAYNTTITDDLTEFIKTFVNSRSDIGVTILKGNETGKVIFNWNNDVATLNVDELLAGQSVSAKFTFNVKNDVVIGKEFKNIAKVDYYSIFNETKFDEKRNYSNQASSTLHTYDAKVNKTVFNTTIVNGKDKVTVGENVTYNITVILPVGKYNILKVTDTLPEGLKYIDGSIVVYKGNTQNKAVEGKDYTVTVNGNIVELTFASEFADEIIKEYGGKFQAFLNATVLNVNNNKAGAVKTNKAVLTWNTHESTSDAAVGIVEPVIDITKNFNVDNVIGGDVIYFDITVTNSGQSPLFNVTLSDDLSDLISKFVSGSINVTSGGAVVTPTWNNNIVSINIAELGIGKSLTYRFTFKIREDVVISSSYTNTANAIGYSAPSNGRNYTDAAKDSFTTKLPVITKWVVDSSIDNGRDKVTIGEKVIYGVNVTLPVGNYTKLVIKDTLPQGFEYIGAGAFYANGTKLVNGKDWTVNVNNYDITITINNVHSSSFANGVLSINLTARPTIFDPSNKEGAVKVNNVELFLNDKTMGRSSAKVTIVEPTADITKKFNVTEVEGLDHVSFDVIVKNNGKTPLFEVTIIDDLEDLASFIGQTPGEDNVVVKVTDADGNPIDAKIRWIGSHVEIDVAQLNPGDIIHAKYSFVIRSDIQIGSQYVNMAYVVGYSAPYHGRIYYNESKDTLKTKMPSITKLVIGTTLGNKEGNIFTPNIGENVTYQIMVKLPKGNYTNLQVKDILPQGFEYLENSVILSNGTLISDVSVNGNLVTINFGNTTSYKYSDNIIFNLSAVVLNDQSNKAQSIKSNNVELYLNDDKIDNSNAQVKIAEPNISVVKTSDKQKYEYYENATYSIVITNNGNGIAYNITIKDVLPLGLKYTGINSTSKSNGWVVEFDENTRTFTVNGLNLTVGDKFTFTYKVSFDEWEIDGVKYSPIGQNFINSVNVAYVSINGTNPNNRTYTTQTTKEVHVTEADLSVVKNCNNKVVIAGEDIYYTIIITNNGLDTAQNVKLNEYYHSEYLTNLEYSLDGKTWNVYTNPVDLGSINSKASKTVYIRGYLDGSIVDDTILNNTVRVNTTTGELKLDDNEATIIKNVTTLAELHVTKVNITEAIAGKIIKYEIVITNNGPSYARDIILKDIYNDSELTNMLYSLDGQSWTRYDASINIGTLANGQNKTILFEGFIKTTVRGNVVNKAVIGSSTKLRDNSTLEDDVAVNVKGDTTLDITKVANTTLVNPGDVIKYTVQITAGGLSDSLDVILTDNLSEMFFDVSKATYSVNGIDKGVWIGNANLGTISSGMTVNVVITVPVKAYVDVGKLNSITNFASVINSDKKAANDTNIVPINVIDLAVNKTANHQNKTYNYGDNVEYVIEIVNNGPGIATDIIATDNLPEGLKFINANVPGGWTLSISNNKITINGEKLANGEKVLITIIAKAAKSNATLINNIKVNGTGFDSNISNNNDSETVKVTPLVDLAITKVVDNANPLFDSIITYTITVVNNGPDASTDVVVKDIWPANGLKFITSTGTYNPATGIWNVGELGSNEIATLTITAKTTAVGKFENKVSVNGTGYDSNLSNNNASVNITVPDCVILNITKVATGGIVSEEPNKEVIAGEKITYTVIVSNYGPSVATNVYLTDLFNADELLNMEYNSNGNWVKYNNGIALGDIDVNEAVMILFRATVNHSTRGLINNTVKITTDIKDARGNFEANETVKAIDNSTLVINKTSNVDAINPGDLFNYTIVITAEGSSDSLGVILTDKLDQSLLDAQNAVFYVNGNYVGKWNGSYNIGTLKTGNSVTVTIEVKALNSANKDIFNKAIVENEEGFINESNKTVHVNTVDLAINKTSDKVTYKYLDNVIYTIVVTNHGPDDSFNVTVRDMLPNTLRFISASGNYNPVTGIWFIGHLAKGQSATLTITAQAIFPGIITNNANVTGSGYDVNLTNNHDNITITVPDCVILNVNKVAIGGVINITGGIKNVVAGEEVIYQVLVSNQGPSTAANVVLTDNYQTKDLTVVAYSLDNITWIPYTKGAKINLGDMNSGSSILVYFKAMVNASTRGIVHNIVNITTDTDDARGIFSAEEHVNVISNSTLKVDKTAEIKELNPGDTIHYIITVTAGGSSDSLNIVLKDILDSTLLDVNGATYAINGVNKGMWTGSVSLDTIATGTTVTVDIWARVLDTADSDVFNLVNVTSDEHPEGNTSNTTVHVRIVDLAVDKLVNNSVPKYLDMIEYTIVVVNNGPDKSFNVTVGDLLPDGVKFISSNGQYNPDTGVWFVGDLDNHESATLKIVVQVIKVGNITNNVNVTGTGHDSNLTNNNDSVSVNVPDCVILDISKVANSTVIVAGENVGYTVVINNYGPSVASDVVLKDIFNSNELLNLQYSLNGKDWFNYNESVSLGDINAGANITVYFRAKVNASVRGNVLNTVNITTGVDDARGNFSDNETVNVMANTTLVVIKDAEIKALNPGDTAHFVITVIAGGSSDSLNVKLEDILDAELLDVKSATYRINGGNLTDYTQIISLGNMHTGSKIVVDIYAAILGTTGQDIFNCVNVTSDEHPEGNTSNTTIHVNIADLEIIKIVDNLTPNYGDEITYTIIVRNNGPDNSTNIKVSEILADNFKFISANASKGYYNLTNGIWAVGNLTNNETAKLVITVKIIKTGFIQNNVSVNGTGYDPNLTNNNATVNITVPQTADLSVIKIVNVNVVTVGDKIIYTIIVKNNGPDTALDIYVVDKLSDALKFVSYKASVGVYNPTTGIWTIGNLTNKSNATLEITCIVLKTGIISNEVFVNGSTVDLNMSNNYDNISVTVNPLPTPVPTPVGPADKDIMISDEVTMDIAAMAKTGNPLFALLVVLIFGIFGFGVSRRKK